MRLLVKASNISGTVLAPPSKSYTHRAMVLAALAHGDSKLHRPLLSADTLATLHGVEKLGAIVRTEEDLCVIRGGKLKAPDSTIDCANSGTSIRLLSGIASLLAHNVTLTGDESLQQRPMKPLINALVELGVAATSARGDGMAPLIIRGPNKGRWAHIKGDVSSQFISSLLIASALKELDTEIVITTPLKSKPYVDITLDMMARFGGRCYITKNGYCVPGGQRYNPQELTIPGDYSSAAFPLVAGALTGKVGIKGLDPQDKQGDKAIVDILRRFGAQVRWAGDVLECSAAPLQGVDVDMGNSPDIFPIIAVLATQAKGTTKLFNAEHLRFKESDRIKTTTTMLKSFGAEVTEIADGCIITGPTKLKGRNIESFKDHRILMAAAVAGLVAEGTSSIGDGGCYDVSYPSFVSDLRAMGGLVEESK
jgi:3-phosphoshikimate 1-carboxyvinyltransferase